MCANNSCINICTGVIEAHTSIYVNRCCVCHCLYIEKHGYAHVVKHVCMSVQMCLYICSIFVELSMTITSCWDMVNDVYH